MIDALRSRTKEAMGAGYLRIEQEGLAKNPTYTRAKRATTKLAMALIYHPDYREAFVYGRSHVLTAPGEVDSRLVEYCLANSIGLHLRGTAQMVRHMHWKLLDTGGLTQAVHLTPYHGRKFAYLFMKFLEGAHGQAAAKIMKEEFKARGLKYSKPRELTDEQKKAAHARLINGQMKSFADKVREELTIED